MNGEGNFNWRFVFPLEYLPTEKVMVIKKKEHFYSLTKAEKRLPPILTMQIWDNDLFSPDDFLGIKLLSFHPQIIPKNNYALALCLSYSPKHFRG